MPNIAVYADSFLDAWIALQIRVVREQRGFTQQQLAEALHTTQTAISRLENANYSGRSISTMKAVARVLDCRLKVSLETYESLIGEAEEFSSNFLRRPSFAEEQLALADVPQDLVNPPSRNDARATRDDGINKMTANPSSWSTLPKLAA